MLYSFLFLACLSYFLLPERLSAIWSLQDEAGKPDCRRGLLFSFDSFLAPVCRKMLEHCGWSRMENLRTEHHLRLDVDASAHSSTPVLSLAASRMESSSTRPDN